MPRDRVRVTTRSCLLQRVAVADDGVGLRLTGASVTGGVTNSERDGNVQVPNVPLPATPYGFRTIVRKHVNDANNASRDGWVSLCQCILSALE